MQHYILNSIVFSIVGILVMLFAFILFERLTPKHNLFKEIFEKQNSAVAIVVGFLLLSIAIIIASAIHG